ncbi:potassium channel family protein [Bifidobacterium mongoliense]|jgi:hypothetical protein|uniref:Ion transport 2 domain protein n=2 Tax=Bifidobacterium mongoliense TaxID=518643 RepID=A0A087BSD4_9BIFI|nr:ion transport 2 domain protein [Bifidobacterium mongoliense DSM 21395]MDN6485662.1 potassium channel family protein [Bifidobacterium mongoliense]MDN6768293.1 potassium channel family protein [Bifidobacterium mongoliense]
MSLSFSSGKWAGFKRHPFDLVVVPLPMVRPLRALWWTFATITTLGYGDYTPVTPTGSIIAFAVMLAGIALIGVVTAAFAPGSSTRSAQRVRGATKSPVNR